MVVSFIAFSGWLLLSHPLLPSTTFISQKKDEIGSETKKWGERKKFLFRVLIVHSKMNFLSSVVCHCGKKTFSGKIRLLLVLNFPVMVPLFQFNVRSYVFGEKEVQFRRIIHSKVALTMKNLKTPYGGYSSKVNQVEFKPRVP